MKRVLIFVIVLALVFPVTVQASETIVKIPNGPSFSIWNVDRGESVTVRVTDFPDGKVYQVYLGRPGDNFGRGYRVGQLTSRLGKSYKKTFAIPDDLRTQTHIAILIKDNTDGSHGYDIFANDTGYDSNTEMSFSAVHRSSAQSAGKSVGIFNGPGYWAGSKGYPDVFTLAFENFFDENSYSVFVGENNGNFQGILVGYVNGKNGPNLKKTYDIPDELKDAEELKVQVVNAFNGHSGSVAFSYEDGYPSVTPYGFFTDTYVGNSGYTSGSATPFTNILNVVADGEVTLQVFNFPADKEFLVTMGAMGTQGIGGYVIGTQSSGEGGSFIATYAIPPQLYGSDYISIRLESTTSDHFTYDYFQNNEGYAATSNSGVTSNNDWILASGTYPSTNVISTIEDQTVTITGTNFTLNDSYIVRMGPIGSQGVGGVVVDTFNTGASRTFTATFSIPDSLKGSSRIAIRFESTNTSYYAYDWFNNQTSP